MYQYFTPVYSEEHFLSASEIAQQYGIFSANGAPHGRLIKLLISSRIEEFHHTHQLPVYYETKKGMMRVYSHHVYDKVMKDFIKKSNLIQEELQSITMIDGNKKVTFKYKIENK